MHFQKREARIDWRKSLTMDEAIEVAAIDMRVAVIDAERRKLSRDLFLIRNRATKRATYVSKRADGAERRGLPA